PTRARDRAVVRGSPGRLRFRGEACDDALVPRSRSSYRGGRDATAESDRVGRSLTPALTDLLSPHRVVQTLLRYEIVMRARFNDSAAFQHVNAVGVHDGREAVC